MREGAHGEPKGAVMDIVGTGDEVGSFNIHDRRVCGGGRQYCRLQNGNVRFSSKSGAADVLEGLGIVTSLSPSRTKSAGRLASASCSAQGYPASP